MAPLWTWLYGAAALVASIDAPGRVGAMQTPDQQIMGMMNSGSNSTSLPPIVMGSIPHWSHFENISSLARGLVAKGYPVSFIAGHEFKNVVEELGVHYVEIGNTDCGTIVCPPELLQTIMGLEVGPEMETEMMSYFFIDMVPSYYQALVAAMRHFNDVRTIMIADSSFIPHAHVVAGAPGIKPHTTIAIGVTPMIAVSNYTYPYRPARHPEKGSGAAEKHWAAWQHFLTTNSMLLELNKREKVLRRQMGARSDMPLFPLSVTATSDIYCPLTVPEFELPRPDMRSGVEFIGIPPQPGVARALPAWWDEMLEAKRTGKKIVAISTSSMDFSPHALTLPALDAMRDRDDIFIVVALVSLDPEAVAPKIPSNGRYSKTIPMDLLLPLTDLIVTSAGYGTIQHALRHEVPMISVGNTEDKPTTGVIIDETGVGIYHKVIVLEVEQAKAFIDKMLSDPAYKKTAEKFRDIYASYDPVEKLDAIIQRETKKFDALLA